MSKRIWITAVVIVGVWMALEAILHKPAEAPRHAASQETTVPLDQLVQSNLVGGETSTPEAAQSTNLPRALRLPESASPLARATAATNPMAGLLLAQWQGRIEFYGKAVDENSNPVAGAQIIFHWVEEPNESGNRTTNAESDAEGLFALHGQLGLSLSVSVAKDGYYSSRKNNNTFSYGPLNGPPYSSDPQSPAIFLLQKKHQGVALISSDNGIRPSLAVPAAERQYSRSSGLASKASKCLWPTGNRPKQTTTADCNKLVVQLKHS